jgi:3'(2'), 5'-bisphosphate nucleotidase
MKLEDLFAVLESVGAIGLRQQKSGFSTRLKPDASPVTSADLEIHSLLSTQLPKLLSEECSFVSEEGQIYRPKAEYQWLVDPIDGTKEFIKGSDDWAIQGALLFQDQIQLGFVYQPAQETMWCARSGDNRVEKWSSNGQAVLPKPQRPTTAEATLVRSASNPDPRVAKILNRHPQLKSFRRGSVGLKTVALCEGEAHAYINDSGRCGPWDLAPCVPLLQASSLALIWLGEPPQSWSVGTSIPGFAMGSPEILGTLLSP